jgi:hypothetical protein
MIVSAAERIEAEREMVSFLRQYCLLMAEHINSIRGLMGSTTDKLMDCVLKISTEKDSKKALADAVLVMRASGDHGKNSIQGDDATFKNASFGSDTGNFANQSTVARLKGYASGLDELDESLQALLFKMVGALSTDDVVGQRLAHVNIALTCLESRLTRVLDQDGKLVSLGELSAIFSGILRDIKTSYTIPEEHRVLDEFFGKVPSIK